MKSFWKYIVSQQSLIYKSLLIISTSVLILYLFPIGGQFKYEFQKGKVWQYPDYYAPFDFSILKSESEINEDRKRAIASVNPYLRRDSKVRDSVMDHYSDQFVLFFSKEENPMLLDSLFDYGRGFLKKTYQYGVLPPNYIHQGNTSIFLIEGNTETALQLDQFFRLDDLFNRLSGDLKRKEWSGYLNVFYNLFFELITPNVEVDLIFYENAKKEALQNLSLSKDLIPAGKLIVSEGVVVDTNRYEILSSLRQEFSMIENQGSRSFWILFGYSILIVLTFTLLLLFIHRYRISIYENNRKLTFIFFNIAIIIVATTLVIGYDTSYLFAVPLCILPLIIKAFFDARLGLFTHVLTVLLIGFIVPNSFEFVFLQILAGIITIQSVERLYRRANLFISVGQIVLVYVVAYLAFTTVQEGTFLNIDFAIVGLFLLNGLLMLFVQPLIYIYEKGFSLVSDVSLLELSDTNSNLLKELSDKAPGTFHHSLQVANLAEAAASEIGANTLLVRVGALYHDIGKLKAPTYFIENLSSTVSPHDELEPLRSAKIIIDHVTEGILLAQKNKIPERIIDFIRTHHGSSTVYYFYKKQQELYPDQTFIEDFQYPGPKPFSKETAILMMADSVEAASKSLKSPDVKTLQNFIEKIINGKMEEQQFNESNITFSEIETVKKVLLKKLINVYQLRIEYPE